MKSIDRQAGAKVMMNGCFETLQLGWIEMRKTIRAAHLSILMMLVLAAHGAQAVTVPTDPFTGFSTSLVAGTGTSGNAGNGGLATAATLTNPYKVAFDASGNMFISDYTANVIRMVTPAGVISTIAGGGTATSAGGACPIGTGNATDAWGDGCSPLAALFSNPTGLAFDPSGNLYVVDANHFEVRKITNPALGTGTITVYGGNGTQNCPTTPSGTVNGGGPTDLFAGFPASPRDIVFDTAGNAYVTMNSNYCRQISKVSPAGIITYFEGNFESTTTPCSAAPVGYVSGSTPAVSATSNPAAYFCDVEYITIDKNNVVYFGGGTYNSVFKVPTTGPGAGIITTVAGLINPTAAADSGDGGPATSASLNVIGGIAVDPNGNVFISEKTGNRIREVLATTGNIYTVAGGGAGFAASGVGAATIGLNATQELTSDANGNIYAADYGNHAIRKLTTTAFANTAVGASLTQSVFLTMLEASALRSITLKSTASTPDFTLGTVSGCTVNGTTSNAIGAVCTIPVTFKPVAPGQRQETIVVTDAAGNVSQVPLLAVGTGPLVGLLPGPISTLTGTASLLSSPSGLSVTDADGDLYIADPGKNVVRKITPAGAISVFAGTGTLGYSGDGAAATAATLNAPQGVAVDIFGNVYIADTNNNVVRVVNAAGIISTFAGTGTAGPNGTGVAPTTAQLNGPTGLATDLQGNVYISDTNNDEIRKVTFYPTALITTIAGTGSEGYSGDGAAATLAALSLPQGIAVDPGGNVFIADTYNDVVRQISASTGFISTVAGSSSGGGYSGDGGLATSAQLRSPSAVSLDAALNLYIADTGNSVIRQVSGGNITTVAGTGAASYQGDGGAATSATLSEPTSVSVDNAGHLYIVDSGNSAVRLVSLTSGTPVVFPATVSGQKSNALTTTLENLGNVSLSLTGVTVSTPFAQSSTTAAGVLNCGTTASATTAATLAGGASCAVSITFTPTAVSKYTGTLSLVDNNGNATGSTQSVALSGAGVTAVGTLTVTVPTVAQGTASQATFAVAASGSSGTPTGTVSYSLDGSTTAATATLVNGTVTVSLGILAANAHSLTAVYSGDTTYGTLTTTQSFSVTGITTTMVVTLGTTPSYGTAIPVTAKLTASSGAVPTGTIAYSLDAGALKYVAVNAGVATFSLGTPPTGTHSLVVTYTGSVPDNTATQTLSVVVAPAPTTTTLSSTLTSAYTGVPFTLTATVSDLIGLVPSGSIQFVDGTTTICSVALPSGSTTVSITIPSTSTACTAAALSPATHQLTAVYGGATNFAQSTSAVVNQVSLPADFTLLPESSPSSTAPISVPITSVNVVIGQQAPLQLFVQGNNDPLIAGTTTYLSTYAYAGTVVFSCSGLPVFMGCSFTPTSVSFTNTPGVSNSYCSVANTCGPVGTTTFPFPSTAMEIVTLGNYQNASIGRANRIVAAGFLLPAVLLAGLLGFGRRRMAASIRRRVMLVVSLLILGGMTGLSGCGYNIAGAPTGTYSITITGTDSVHNLVRSTVLTVVATK